ncbi:MAG TPA: hypothetical protein VHA37_07915 [Candidatus Saccharimonadales bacterium]|nr:hypothetical protein [Candidatus Saccharimonadales bacterium]
MRLAVDRADDPRNISFISAGSSIGAELYGLAALYEGHMEAEGYDVNRLALETARRGVYKVLNQGYPGDRPSEEILEELGFAVLDEPPEGIGAVTPPAAIVSAAPLRERHDIRFIEHDLTKPLPREKPADLILVNNILHLVKLDDAVEITRNLGRVLADSGVLSMGEPGMIEPPSYRLEATDLLAEEFGIMPLVRDEAGQPIMFGKS